MRQQSFKDTKQLKPVEVYHKDTENLNRIDLHKTTGLKVAKELNQHLSDSLKKMSTLTFTKLFMKGLQWHNGTF